jgi:hypothetical protein
MLGAFTFVLTGCGREKQSDNIPGATILVFDYLDASKIQTIELFGKERLLHADAGSNSVSDYAPGVEFETSYSRDFRFNELSIESLKIVRVAGLDHSVELDASSLEWKNHGAGQTYDGFQYDTLYVTILDSRSKPLFP